MKTLILFLVLFLWCLCLSGQNQISEEKIIENAQLFLQKRDFNLRSAKSMQLTKFLENKSNKNQIYIHNVGDKDGWIITEKIDDKLLVLGYSLTGSFDYEKSVLHVKKWLSIKLDSLSLNKPVTKTLKSEKAFYRLDPFLKTKNGKLIQWNQMPLYNDACPVIDSTKTPIGCAATAMGQLMRFWEFPYKSRGSVDYQYTYLTRDSAIFSWQRAFGKRSYNWDKMPASLTDSSSAEEIKEVSEFLFDVGLSIKTAYNVGGSAVAPANIVGLNRNFNFTTPNVFHIYNDMSDSKTGADSIEFHSQVIDDLEKGYPVLVIGYVFGGFHLMVCDGYDNEGFYHLNYGWGGQSDGYYHFSENVWCAYQDYLFVDAFVDMIPLEVKYSSSVVDYHTIVKPGQQESITLQIEENDRSFPFYIQPIIQLKKTNGSINMPVFSYSFDTIKSTVKIIYQTPAEEGAYDLTVSLKAGKDNIKLADFNLTVDDDYKNISGDIQIASVNSDNNFSYETPKLNIKAVLYNKSITSLVKIKGEILSDQGVVEYNFQKNFSLSGDSTQIDFEIPLRDIPFGNKQIKISADYDNQVSETNESNNILSIPVSYNREIPLTEWEILKTFYTDCSGSTWINKKGWMTNEPVGTWDGVKVKDGHVIELSNTFDNFKYVGNGYMTGACESNSFMSGGFPKNLDKLSKLEVIDFASAQIVDSIPQSIINLKGLKTLNLNSCNLFGKIPKNIGELTNLEKLLLEWDNLTGELPSSVFNLTKLKWLMVSCNFDLSGSIDSIGKLQNMVLLRLDRTKIGGKFPAAIFDLPNLMQFSANSCLFTGQIPVNERTNNLLNCFSVTNNSYDSNKNQLEGDIFKTLVHCTDMRLLDISNNKFTGTIPSSIVGAKVAREFNLSNNNFDLLEPIVRDTLSPFLTQLNVQNNNLGFQSFEDNQELLKRSFFTYSPQKAIGEKATFQITTGENYNYPFSCSGSMNSYQWYYNGAPLGSASENGNLKIDNVSPANSGEYFCKVSNPLVSNLSLTTNPIILSVNTPAGLKGISDTELTIYPNPVHQDMPISITGLKDNWSSIKITNLLGKVLYNEMLNKNEDLQTKEIDISKLSKGLYLMQFVKKGKTVTKKFIVL